MFAMFGKNLSTSIFTDEHIDNNCSKHGKKLMTVFFNL